MFTVCPKCALTLVVTAADLKVAQGYVRCGRCSNVFNAIAALSEDRGQQGSSSSSGGVSTTVIRKAPSISDDPPPDPLSDTGESEAIYAEPQPDPAEVKFQEVFVEPEAFVKRPPQSSTAASAAPRAAAPAAKLAPSTTSKQPGPKTPADEPRYDDDSEIPESALEFNPSETDVTKVFVDPAPTRKIDMTGTHEKLALTGDDEPTVAASTAPAGAAAPAPARPPASTTAPAARPPQRDAEDLEIQSQLLSLAAKLDATGSNPVLKRPGGAGTPSGSPYNSADEPANLALKAARARRAALRDSAAPPDDLDANTDGAGAEAAAEELTGPPPSRKRRIAWIAGIVGLGVVLGAQAIHRNRNDLATDARFNRPLTRFYAAIGAPIVPNWNPASFDVRQLGASTGNDSGNLTVRASLKNGADQPLPLPLLRITVQDRYGNRIATRDVPPSGYMPGAVPEGARLGAGQRVDAEMTFKDPGRDAVGFEIDACLVQASGRIACANDAVAR